MKLAIIARCSFTLRILYHTPFKMLVFSEGKENILCYLEFSMVTLCPEVTCPSKETFSIMQYFFNSVVCIYRGRHVNGGTNKLKNILRFLSECRTRMTQDNHSGKFQTFVNKGLLKFQDDGGSSSIFLTEENVILREECDWKYLKGMPFLILRSCQICFHKELNVQVTA